MSIFLILALGLFLRVINLNQTLWLDEATSVLVARDFSFAEIITRFSPGDFHPPLYYFLLKVWIFAFGASEVAARSLSVTLGSATIPLVFLTGRKLLNKGTGLVAALFFATAPLHIYYSQEARMYAMATFFVTLFVWFFLLTLDKRAGLSVWMGFFIAGVLAFYTHYLTLTLLFVVALYLFLHRRYLGEKLIGWFSVFLLFIFCFFPWLPVFSQQFQNASLAKINTPLWWEVLGRTGVKELALVPIKFLIGRVSSYNKVFYALSVSFPLALSTILFIRSIPTAKKTLFVWLWLFVPVAISVIFGLVSSGFSYFRLLFVLPAFYLLLSVGAFSLNKKWQRLAVAGVLLVNIIATSIYLFNPRFHREDWRGAVSWIEENSKERNTAVLFVANSLRDPYFYYVEKPIPVYGPDSAGRDYPDTIWLMRYAQPILDSRDILRKKVENNGYLKVEEKDFNGIVVWKYRR